MNKGGDIVDRNNMIIVHPTSRVRNNLSQNREFEQGKAMVPYSTVYYSEVLASKLKELRELQEKVDKMNIRLNSLESRLQSKIVTAPLREESIVNDALKRRQAIVATRTSTTHHIPTSSLETQNYIKATRAYTNIMNQTAIKYTKPTTILPIETKTEKPSFWQKIKNAVKDFFGASNTEEPKKDTKSNYSNNPKNSNQKYNQFRESIPKKEVKIIDVKTNNTIKKEPSEHIFDRYA